MTARPVVMSVDDDPSVSRAVARDLRRHLGDDYRVVRAESGPDALEALRELTVRGEVTALLLADHRMPGMTGVEFLEQAMDLVPEARRVLLTAYADTDAAIRAINDVDLDRYLLKPWDPPEEHLYPVLDELLTEWRARARPVFEGLTLVGHQWSAQTQVAKEFLALAFEIGQAQHGLGHLVEERLRLVDELPGRVLADVVIELLVIGGRLPRGPARAGRRALGGNRRSGPLGGALRR